MSFSASEPFRVLSGAHWGSGWRSQIFWRGWSRGQAALQSLSAHQFRAAVLKQRHLEPCRAPGLLTNTSVVSSLLEDIPKASQDYFCFLVIISYWQLHHSTHALHTPQMLVSCCLRCFVACFLSRGSRLTYIWVMTFLLFQCSLSFVLVQSLNPLSNWSSLNFSSSANFIKTCLVAVSPVKEVSNQ